MAPDLSRKACVFCQIFDGALPASEIYRDDICVALMTIGPVNPGHAMVIPLEHIPYLADMTPDEAGHIFKVAQRVAAALRRSDLPCDGVNLFVADGEAAHQDVFHFHLHVYPRISGDGFGFKHDERHFRQPPQSELDRVAAFLRDAMDQD